MNATHSLARLVHGFFQEYMAGQKGLSPNTILSYRDAVKLFLCFAAKQVERPVDRLDLEDFDEPLVLRFLDDLEASRGNCVAVRNNRLAALRAFFRYVAGQEPLAFARCQRICTIATKRKEHQTIEYLEDNEVAAVLKSIDRHSRNGARDYALLLFLYNTGARVQEVVDLKLADVRLQIPFQVKLCGKGRKERLCPLWPESVEALAAYFSSRKPALFENSPAFVNANGRRITRFGIRYLVRQYAGQAAQSCPSVKFKKVSPHTWRHTTAMHLLQSGNDISVVKHWLGHADVNTTHGYVEIDMNMKRKALELCEAPHTKTAKALSKWSKPSILKWLDQLSQPSGNNV
jgi:site-specific recombinase XerD